VSIDHLVAAARAEFEAIMTDTCVIRRQTGETTDPATGEVIPTYTQVYAGGCRLQLRGLVGREVQAGEQPVALSAAELQLPSTATGVLAVDDVAEITGSTTTPQQVGTRWRVQAATPKTHQTKLVVSVQSLPWGDGSDG
jgi:hypothetical protein